MSDHDPNQTKQTHEELPPGVELRPHVFDGIEEYDQRLPNWWLWTWYIAMILFAIFWVGYYQFGLGKDDFQRIEEHNLKIAQMQADKLQELFAADPNGALWKMSRNAAAVESGKKIFDANCVACHAKDLSAMEGGMKLAGLPLNDKVWKYGADATKADAAGDFQPVNVFNIVKGGSPDKASGMQAWLPNFGPQGVAEVVAYVLSHHEAPAGATAEDAATK